MARSAWSSTVAAVGLAVCFVASVAAAAEPAVTPDHPEKMARGLALFKDHVRATLIQHCVKCHGGQKIKAKLDLTTRPTLLRGGKDGAVIVPGQPAKSLMVKLITHADEPHMPYKADRLPDEAIKQIAAWIENGAPFDKPLLEDKARAAVAGGGAMQVTDEDRDFWSFRPLSRPAPPKVANAAWCRTPIDQFIMAKLEAHGLTPNPSVDRRKLIRRAYLDLLGLPPTPEAIDAFINDPAADAYEKLVDNLLASPHYGERWGRHWLDVARFAESHGFEQDYNREFAFFYRDFVIKALNADMPFDQFVRWQLAGDEFEPDNPLAMMATGFLGAGVFPTQLTEKEFEPARYDELDDMAQTMGTAMLGLTVGCARCHDHKYDPIPTRDYYRLIATFTTTIRSNIDLALDSQATRLAQAKWQSEHAPLVAALKQYENDQLPARFDQWLATRKKGQGPPPTWIVLDLADFKSQGGATLTKLADGSLLASGQNPDFDVYTFVARTHLKGITAIRLEALADPSMVKGGPGRAPNGNMGVGEFTITAEPLAGQGKPVAVKLVNPRATFQQNGGNLSIAASIDGDKKTGWAVDPQFGKDHAAIFDTAEPVGFDGGTKLTFTLTFNVNNKHNIGRPRLSISTVPSPADFHGDAARQNVTEILAIIDKAGGKPTDAQRRELLDWFATTDPQWRQLHDKVQVHLKNKPKLVTTKVMVTSEGFKPIPHHADGRGFPHFYPQTYFLKRGDTSQKHFRGHPTAASLKRR